MMKCNQCAKENIPEARYCQECGLSLFGTGFDESTLVPLPTPPSPISYVSPDARCPTCGSNRLQRISPGGKVFKIAAVGVFGLGDVHKIFRCLNCGYKW